MQPIQLKREYRSKKPLRVKLTRQQLTSQANSTWASLLHTRQNRSQVCDEPEPRAQILIRYTQATRLTSLLTENVYL